VKYGYDKGYITEKDIDARVEKILQFIEKAENARKTVTTTKQQRHEQAFKIARDGIVLLKNEEK
jgi:beta-glucosidase-like glycosyl hydrolase